MSLTFTLQLSSGPIEFTRLVRLTHVDGIFNGKPQVWFSDYDKAVGQERNGVTIVLQDRGVHEGRVLYCSSLNNRRAAQDWLYARNGFLYKESVQTAKVVAEAKAANGDHKIEIFFSRWGDATQIIRELRPPWNV